MKVFWFFFSKKNKRFFLKKEAKTFILFLLGVIALLWGLDRAFPPALGRLAEVGSEVLARDGRTLALLPAPGGVWRFRVRADEVAPVLVETLVAIEDRRFWWHPGVDPLALARAAFQDLRAGRIVSGGSTLTMQAARLLEPRPRTWRSKLIEIARAVQLEWHFSKQEILGIWLSLAPYGGNLEGVRAGSLAWFGQGPRMLDRSQAALLVAIPRRPEALRPDRHAARARVLRDRILGGDGGAMPMQRVALPRHARQAVAALPRDDRVATTLDLGLQRALERLAAEHLRRLPGRASLALLVADLGTRELRAVVSGGDGPQAGRAGAMDLSRAVRSPGSAMKPFIYAMAFQDGIAGPATRIDDLPRRFGAYAPEDFDRGFQGSVTAADALRRSLNLPAVALLDRVGPLRFAATMKAAGVALHLPPGADPSLPLALGGAGITLRDLAGLYAALGSDGQARPLRLVPGEAAGRGFLQPRAAAAIAEVLTQPFPDGGPAGVAWKTGTSWGGRDAWALGFDAAHVAGVWVGRPDGTPLPGATGRNLALPLLARVMEMLPASARPAPHRHPAPEQIAHGGQETALRLLSPPPGAVLSDGQPVVLRVMGGRRPLSFLVDGARLAADPARREVAWQPSGPGFYRLTVLDSEGAAARAVVRVKRACANGPPPCGSGPR
ncbi:MAG: transglycosylase domain-containing protein [Acetobacteraceae bacterium]|nr:transglycosylase domain-containing protein [Acetobacteraceae bacterium]